METLEQTKELLRDHKEILEDHKKEILKLDQKYVGKTLRQYTEMREKWIKEETIYIDALENYILKMENDEKASTPF